MAWEPGRGGAEDRLLLSDPYRRSPAAAGRQSQAPPGGTSSPTRPVRAGGYASMAQTRVGATPGRGASASAAPAQARSKTPGAVRPGLAGAAGLSATTAAASTRRAQTPPSRLAATAPSRTTYVGAPTSTAQRLAVPQTAAVPQQAAIRTPPSVRSRSRSPYASVPSSGYGRAAGPGRVASPGPAPTRAPRQTTSATSTSRGVTSSGYGRSPYAAASTTTRTPGFTAAFGAGQRAGSTGPARAGPGTARGTGALQPTGGRNDNWLTSYQRSSQDFIGQLQVLLGQVDPASLEAEARAAPQAPAAPPSTWLSQQPEAAVAAPAPSPPGSALAGRKAGVGSLAALAMSLDKEIAELLGSDAPIRPAQQPAAAQQPRTPNLASAQPQAHAQPLLPPRASAQPVQAQSTQQQTPMQSSMPSPVPKLTPSSTTAAADKLADILREFSGTGAGAAPVSASGAGPSERSTSAITAGRLGEPRAAPALPTMPTAAAAGTGPGADSGADPVGTVTTAATVAAGVAAAAPVSLPPGAVGELWSVLQASKQNAARLAADLKAAQQEAEEAKERQQEADDLARMFQSQLLTRQQQLSSWTTAMVEMQEREASAKELLRTAQDRCTQLAQQAKQAQHVAVTAQLRLERILADQQKQQKEMQSLREAATHAASIHGSPASTWPRPSARSRPSQTGCEQETDAAGSSAGGASSSATHQAALDLRSLRADMAAAQSRATRAELELAVARNRAIMAQQELAEEEERARRAATATGAAQEELERTRAALELMGRDHDRLRAQLEEMRQQLRARDEAEARRATEAAVQAAKAAVSTLVAAESRGHAVPRSSDSPTSASGTMLLPMGGAGGGWGAGSAGGGTNSPLLNTLLSTGDMVAQGSATVSGLATEPVSHGFLHHHHHHQQQQQQLLRPHPHLSSLERPDRPYNQRQSISPPQHQQHSARTGVQDAAPSGRGGPGPVSGGVSMLTLTQFRAGAEKGSCGTRDTPEVSSISYGHQNLLGSVSTSSSSAGGSGGGDDSGRGSTTAVMARLGAAAAAAAAQKQGPAARMGQEPDAGAGADAVAAGDRAIVEDRSHAAAAGQPRSQAVPPMPMLGPTWSSRRNSLLLLVPADLPGGEAGPPSRYSSQRRPSAALHARKSQEEMQSPTPRPSGATAVHGRPSSNGKAVVAADDNGPGGEVHQSAGIHGPRARSAAGLSGRGSVEGDGGCASSLRPALGVHQSMVHRPRHLVSPPRRASSHDHQAPAHTVAAGGVALAAGGTVSGQEGMQSSSPSAVRVSAEAVAVTSGGLASLSVGTRRAMRMLLDASCTSGGAGGARSSTSISVAGGLTDEMVPLSRAPSSARRRLSYARSSTATGVGQRVGRHSGSGVAATGAGAGAGAATPMHAAPVPPADTSAATQAWVNSVSRRPLQSGLADGATAADGASSLTTQQLALDSPLPPVLVDPAVSEVMRRVQSAERAWAAAAAERKEASTSAGAGASVLVEGASAAVQAHATLAELRQQIAAAATAGSRAPGAGSAGTPSAGTGFWHESTSAAPETDTRTEMVVEPARVAGPAPVPPAARPSAATPPPPLQPTPAAATANNRDRAQRLAPTPVSGAAHGHVLAAVAAAEARTLPTHQPPNAGQPRSTSAPTPPAPPVPRLSLQTAPLQAFKSFPDPEPSDSPRERVRHTPRRGGRRSRSPSPGPNPTRPAPTLRGPADQAAAADAATPSSGSAASIIPAAPKAVWDARLPGAAVASAGASPALLPPASRAAEPAPLPAGTHVLEAAAPAQQQVENAHGAYKGGMQLPPRVMPYRPPGHDNSQPHQLPTTSLNDSASTVTHGHDVACITEVTTATASTPASRAIAAAAAGSAHAAASPLHSGAPGTATGPGPAPSNLYPYQQLDSRLQVAEAHMSADAESAALLRQLVLTPRSRMMSPSQLESYRVSTSLAASSVADSLAAGGDASLSGSFAFGHAGPAGLLPSHAKNAPPLPLLQQQLGRSVGIGAGAGRSSGLLSPVAEQRALEARVLKAHGLDVGLTPLRVLARSASAGEVVPGGSPGRSTTAPAVVAEHRSAVQQRSKPWWLRLMLAVVGRGGATGAAADSSSCSGSSSDSGERLPSYMRLDSPGKAPARAATDAPASPMQVRLGTSSPYAVRDSRFSSPVHTVPTSPKPAPATEKPSGQSALTPVSARAGTPGRSSEAHNARLSGATDKRSAKGTRRRGVGAEVQQALINAAITAGGMAVGVAIVLGVAGWAERAVERRRSRMDGEEAPAPGCGCRPQAAPRRQARGPQEVAEIEEGRAGVRPGRED
ncbi:hypothetical protein CHLRE_02g098900v5 [Chlamydomonas reinhardtii]|uniref:Uncharacterized protein n=1 Tax=Chlamydomonas reinhardtii TaxID=3055 RepID=A0A2K3E259_CHLRE|nr:uncharacterized protein CHLRE_02g098900v5 [Chlamydomonas reinhardtii]PNW86863.1 hypothetical protein CHLRE_02g098900v5 [Chlamydomonas reinhardtii]